MEAAQAAIDGRHDRLADVAEALEAGLLPVGIAAVGDSVQVCPLGRVPWLGRCRVVGWSGGRVVPLCAILYQDKQGNPICWAQTEGDRR